MSNRQDYISLDDAAAQLKVTRPTLYYYMRVLKMETEKFPLDRKAYLLKTDVERIRTLREQASGKDGDEAA